MKNIHESTLTKTTKRTPSDRVTDLFSHDNNYSVSQKNETTDSSITPHGAPLD